jgi:methionyl-tRNA formyltransferase
MRILFWGTPDFAVPPLRALLGEGSDVVGVVTQPDRPRGRSRSRLDPSPVKQVAAAEGIPVLQPERPRGDAFMDEVRALAPDLSVVVAYGHILPRAVIDLPPWARSTSTPRCCRCCAAPTRSARPSCRGSRRPA